ncbi:MAG: hypothetical protein CMH89_02305 [Oceanicaulis sp.]|nr:hypothetical protein [Oceanicaulis sp.]MAO49385.1 hypothetical protein [Pusillimonas sp.]HCR93477.1 hypothetical protein [Oceanicaulis sp.]
MCIGTPQGVIDGGFAFSEMSKRVCSSSMSESSIAKLAFFRIFNPKTPPLPLALDMPGLSDPTTVRLRSLDLLARKRPHHL